MNGVYFQNEQRSDMKNKRNDGMSKGEIMNRLATSKEDILAASRELIKENGWAAVLKVWTDDGCQVMINIENN